MGSADGDGIDVWQVTLDYAFDVWEGPPADIPFRESPEGYIFHTNTIPPSRIVLLGGWQLPFSGVPRSG